MLLFVIYVLLCAVLVPLFRTRGIYGYDEAKEQLFITLTVLTYSINLFISGAPIIAGAPALFFLSFLTLLTVSVLWTDNKENALQDLPRWWTLFFFFLICGNVPKEFLLPAVFVPAVFHSLYAMIQQGGPYKKRKWLWFTHDPLWKRLNDDLGRQPLKLGRFFGWLGNSNFTASYLVPCFFIGCYLVAVESPWYIIGLVPIWIGIGISRCRAAWLSTIIGLSVINAVINPWSLLVLIPGMVIMSLIATQRIEPIMGRWFYLQICWRLFKQMPVFGHGPRVFRRKIFDIQAEMNAEDPTYLGTPEVPGRNAFPVGKRAHNDHAETLIETGIVGYGLLLAFFAACIISSNNIFITGGLIAVIVHAFFFYNLRMGATALPFFAMAGLSAGSQGFTAISIPVAILISALLICLAHRLAWLPFRNNLLHCNGMTVKEKKQAEAMLFEALYYDPHNNAYLNAAAQLHMPDDPPNALLALIKAMHHNDGQELPWTAWFRIGQLSVINNAFYLARSSFMKAIQLNPAFAPAHMAFKEVQNFIDQIEAQIKKPEGRIIIPNGKTGKVVQIIH